VQKWLHHRFFSTKTFSQIRFLPLKNFFCCRSLDGFKKIFLKNIFWNIFNKSDKTSRGLKSGRPAEQLNDVVS
jgi:hypothetical protein